MHGSVGEHVRVCLIQVRSPHSSAHFRSSRLVDPPLFDLVKLAS